ncbi:MAG: alpha/beta fold hydrolase [Treponema sp.]|nr:alpha/beta fold hydrolase [Treponema sp.]
MKRSVFIIKAVLILFAALQLAGCKKTGFKTKAPEIEDVSATSKQIFFYRDGLRIYGNLYIPEGEGPFPLVILSYGAGGNHNTTDSFAKLLATKGIAGLSFDFIGSASRSTKKSDGEVTDMTVLTQAADIKAILYSLNAFPYIDKNNVFLWGHSLGGLASTYAATQNPKLVKGLIALEPSYQMRDQTKEAFPNPDELPDIIYTPLYCGKSFVTDMLSLDIYKDMPKFKNSVLIIRGTVNSIGSDAPEYLDRAADLFPKVSQVSVDGASHTFDGKYRQIMQDMTIDFVKEQVSSK